MQGWSHIGREWLIFTYEETVWPNFNDTSWDPKRWTVLWTVEKSSRFDFKFWNHFENNIYHQYVLWWEPCVTDRLVSMIHYNDVIMGAIASQITSLTIVYSIVYSDADQRKHQSSASLAFVRGIHRGPVNYPHKWPVTRKMFPFDDVIMCPWLSPCCAMVTAWLLWLQDYNIRKT